MPTVEEGGDGGGGGGEEGFDWLAVWVCGSGQEGGEGVLKRLAGERLQRVAHATCTAHSAHKQHGKGRMQKRSM